MTDTTFTPGHFVWHEIATPDIEKSKAFYAAVLGWTYNEMPMPDGAYTMIMNGEAPQGGVFDIKKLPNDKIPPHWMSYVSVPNVDEAVAAAKSGGGTAPMDAMDIPNVGRMAPIGDPQHAHTTAFKAATGDPALVEKMPTGNFCWDQLNTTDVEAAKKFYAKVYGWNIVDFNGMATFAAGERGVASIMPAPEGVPSHWVPYVVVDDIAATRKAATDNGGNIILEAMAIPGVGTIGVITDNVGAFLGIMQPE